MKKLLFVLFVLAVFGLNVIFMKQKFNNDIELVDIPVLKETLEEGTVINVNHIIFIKFPQKFLNDEVIIDYKLLENNVLKTKIMKHQHIYSHMLGEKDDLLKYGEFLYDAKFQVHGLSIGHTLDIAARFKKNDQILTECLVSNARVLQIDPTLLLAVKEKDLYYLLKAELFSDIIGIESFYSFKDEKEVCHTLNIRKKIDEMSR
jgi:hypothetical protein